MLINDEDSFGEEFDQQLGPFYKNHGEEIVPSGYEESAERMIATMGVYEVKSNLTCFPAKFRIGHYDITKYIQEDWDRMSPDLGSPPGDFPRRGFLMSSRSASQAAGRAAEEIILEKLLWRLQIEDRKRGEVIWFYDAVDRDLVVKPKGVGSDDYLVRFDEKHYVLVESKASFRATPDKYIEKASRQLAITCRANDSIRHVMLALTDLSKKTIRMVLVERVAFLSNPLESLRQAIHHL